MPTQPVHPTPLRQRPMKFSTLLIGAGLLVVISNLVYGSYFLGVPYPDPTPAQRQAWAFHMRIFDTGFATGLGLTFAGIVLAVARKILGSPKPGSEDK